MLKRVRSSLLPWVRGILLLLGLLLVGGLYARFPDAARVALTVLPVLAPMILAGPNPGHRSARPSSRQGR